MSGEWGEEHGEEKPTKEKYARYTTSLSSAWIYHRPYYG